MDPTRAEPATPVPGRAACRFCGAALDPHQAASGAVCDAAPCRMRQVQSASRAVFQRDWDSYLDSLRRALEEAGPMVARAVRIADAPADQLAIGAVPRQDRPLVELPDDRREAFATHLAGVIAAAFETPLPAPEPAEATLPADEPPLIQATCATCQGKCCALGGPEHAFIRLEDIQRFRRRNPAATAADVLAHYLAAIPARSVEFACVFQGATGCVLPRDERGTTCNRYHCNQQTQILTRMAEMQATKAVIVAHADGVGPALAVLDGASWRPVAAPEPDEAAPDAAEALATLDAALSQLPPPLIGPGPAPTAPTCRYCAAPLSPHQAATTQCCGAEPCAQRRLDDMAARLGAPD